MATASEIQIVISAKNRADAQLRSAGANLGAIGRQGRGLIDVLGKIGLAAIGIVAVTKAFAGLASGLINPIKAASDLNETINKTNVVFGNSARAVLELGDVAAASLGQSRNEALAAAATFGNLFTSMGLTRSAAADMSIDVVKLASDLASFNNAAPVQVLEDLRSGLVGEIEPLRKYGIAINETTVQQEAMRLGLAKTKDAISEADKVTARYSLILRQSANSHGDFARTVNDTANSLRVIDAEAQDFVATLGEKLLPGIQPIIQALGKQLPAVMPIVIEALKPLTDEFVRLGQRIAEFIASDEFPIWVKRVVDETVFVIQALGVLTQAFATAFDSIARIVLSVGAIILQAFALINPFVPHSPPLVQQVEDGFARIAKAIGDLPGRVVPALRAAGSAMSDLGAATEAAFVRAGAAAEASLLKQIALLGSGAVPAYIAARDRLAELDEQLRAVNDALEIQTGLLSDMEAALKPMEEALDRVRERVRGLRDEISETERAIRELANAPIEGENAQNQVIFGLRNAINILEFQREKLLQSGVSKDDPRIKALDEEIKRNKDRLRLEELRAKAEFDGQRNAIEQAARAAEADKNREQRADSIIGKIREQAARLEELKGALLAAETVEAVRLKDVEAQQAAIAEQKRVVDELAGVQDKLIEQARMWKEEMDRVAQAARDLEAALKKAAGAGGGAGLKVPPLPPPLDIPLPKKADRWWEDMNRNLQEMELSPLDDLKLKLEGALGPLKEMADRMQAAAGGGTTLAEAIDNLTAAWERNQVVGMNKEGKKSPLEILKDNWIQFGNDLTTTRSRVQDALAPIWDPVVKGWAAVAAWWNGDGATLRSNIATWLGTGIGLQVDGFKTKWGEIQTAWETAVTWWNGTGQTWRDAIGTWLGTGIATQVDGFKTKWAEIQTAWETTVTWWNGDGATWRAAIGTFLTTTVGGWIDTFKIKWGEIQTAWQTTVDFLAGVFKTAIDQATTSGPLATLLNVIKSILKAIEDALAAFNKLKNAISNGVGSLPQFPIPGGGSGGGGRGINGLTVPLSNTIYIDARGMSTNQLTQAVGNDLASQVRSRLVAGAV